MENEAERQKFEEIMMAFVRIGRDGSVPVDVRNFATEWRDKVQAYIAARASEASPPQPEPLRKALEAIANDPIIGKETLDPAAMWYRSIAANALSGAAATAPSAPTATDAQIQAFWNAQAEWSQATFGTDAERDHIGPLKHLAKEAVEAQVRPADYVEIADCLFLVFDAARRSGMTIEMLIEIAEKKLVVNKARKWSKPTSDEPVEHVREAAPTATDWMRQAATEIYQLWNDWLAGLLRMERVIPADQLVPRVIEIIARQSLIAKYAGEHAATLTIEIERETDGRWIAEVPSVPGCMVYGSTRSEAIVKVGVLLEEIEAGEHAGADKEKQK